MICISAWPCDLCLPLQRQKLSVCFTVTYGGNEAASCWWNWLVKVKKLLDLFSLLHNLSLSSFRKSSLRLGVLSALSLF